MPSTYQKASLTAMLWLFLETQRHALPEHTPVKSASALSRFLNRYGWPTRQMIRASRQSVDFNSWVLINQVTGHHPVK